jgi:hypothetical protein
MERGNKRPLLPKTQLSLATEKSLSILEQHNPEEVSTLRRELLVVREGKDSNCPVERFIVYRGGDYVWVVGSEIFRFFIAPRSQEEDKYRLVRYSDCGADELGTFSSKKDAKKTRDEFFRVLAARDLLSGFYSSTNELEWRLKIWPINKDDWEDIR